MKRWFQSKTMLVNFFTLAAGVLAVFQGSDWIMSNPGYAAAILTAVGGVNMVLRLFTSKAVR